MRRYDCKSDRDDNEAAQAVAFVHFDFCVFLL